MSQRIVPPYALIADPPRERLARLYCSVEESCGQGAEFRLINPHDHDKRWDACQDHCMEATYRSRRGLWPEKPQDPA